MKTFLNIVFILLFMNCDRTVHEKEKNQLIVEINQEPKVNDTSNKEASELFYDYLEFDSLLINCKVKPFSSYDTLLSILGEPDTIIEYKSDRAHTQDTFFYLRYDSMAFHRDENNKTTFYTLTLGESKNTLCYKGFMFNKSTTLESIASMFPKSYSKRNEIKRGQEILIAVRFFTSKKINESEWIMLFNENRLKYFHFFDGDD